MISGSGSARCGSNNHKHIASGVFEKKLIFSNDSVGTTQREHKKELLTTYLMLFLLVWHLS